MRKPITFFDLFRFLIAAAIFISGYFVAEHYIYKFFLKGEVTLGFLILKYLLIEGLGCYISMFAGLLFVSRRYKIVAGTIIMLISMILYIIDACMSGFPNYIVVLAKLAGLSFVAIGTSFSIMTWMKITDRMKKKQASPAKPGVPKAQASLSRILLFFAAISVPATYLIMVLSPFITIGLCAWVLGIFMLMETIPNFILIALIIAPIVAIWASVAAIKSVFSREPHENLAISIKLDDKPRLKETIEGVCRAIKTKMPDNVILHSEPNFFVSEYPVKTINAVSSGRTLAIGAPLLRALSYNEFRAVIGHEFAHFSGRDTMYSSFVLPVYRSVTTALQNVSGTSSSGGSAAVGFMNALLLVPSTFLQIFLAYFAMIDSILSRSRELRADWLAAQNFGSTNMKNALISISGSGRFFSESIRYVPGDGSNFFAAYHEMLKNSNDKIEGFTKELMNETAGDYDSHPALSERIDALPDGTSTGIHQGMDFITEELKTEEEELSVKVREILNKITAEAGEAPLKTVEDLDLLSELQFDILRKVYEDNAELGATEEDRIYIARHLVTGEEIPSNVKELLQKAAEILKRNAGIAGLFMKGASIRIKVLIKNGHEARTAKLKELYNSLGLELSADHESLPSIENYGKEVLEYRV